MPEAGDVFPMPDGSVYSVRRPSHADGGASVQMEFLLPHGCIPPPPHVHASQVEDYEVLEGRFEVMVDGRWSTLGPGERAEVPVGALHTFRNRSGAPVRVLNHHRPALGFDVFIARMSTALRDAGIRRPRDPRVPLVLSAVMEEFPEFIAFPRRQEAVPVLIAARLGRGLGIVRPPA